MMERNCSAVMLVAMYWKANLVIDIGAAAGGAASRINA